MSAASFHDEPQGAEPAREYRPLRRWLLCSWLGHRYSVPTWIFHTCWRCNMLKPSGYRARWWQS